MVCSERRSKKCHDKPPVNYKASSSRSAKSTKVLKKASSPEFVLHTMAHILGNVPDAASLECLQREETKKQLEGQKLFGGRLNNRNLDFYASLMNDVTIYNPNGVTLKAPDYTFGNPRRRSSSARRLC